MVEMGPFKHKVDDGLEIRKSAFECMYTLLDSCLDKIEIFGFIERVFAGLNDQHDIKVLAHLMMMRLANVAPTPPNLISFVLILNALDDVELDDTVEPLKSTLNHKVKQTAVKQEVEKNQELVRSALRCIAVLAKLSEPAITPRFDTFIKEVKASGLAEEYKAIVADAESKERRGADYMDLS
ncbi:TATA-binding protein interacting [Endogone sp. FLAS-F59071]|nr:TATA-binding protein interacting [Endogone sp. FLAS-F59071]|eukprot:RUS15042.1 TATA-binding protein interacting [Endogone sp. FLAS-F59071]